jgi:hypothetical protein
MLKNITLEQNLWLNLHFQRTLLQQRKGYIWQVRLTKFKEEDTNLLHFGDTFLLWWLGGYTKTKRIALSSLTLAKIMKRSSQDSRAQKTAHCDDVALSSFKGFPSKARAGKNLTREQYLYHSTQILHIWLCPKDYWYSN